MNIKSILIAITLMLSQIALSAHSADDMSKIDSTDAVGVPGITMQEISRDATQSVFRIQGTHGANQSMLMSMFLACGPATIATTRGYKSFNFTVDAQNDKGEPAHATKNESLGSRSLLETVIWLDDAHPAHPFVASAAGSGGRVDVAVMVKKCDALRHQATKMGAQKEGAKAGMTSNQNCNGRGPMRVPPSSREFGGVVVAPATPADTRASVVQGQQRMNGEIDPEYLNSQRVVIHPDAASPGINALAVIPSGLGINIGQHVVYRTGYADPDRACHYLPNMIVRADR